MFALVADAPADIPPGESVGGVFIAIGEDGDDDGAGAVGLGKGGECGAEFVDGAGGGVEQGGGAARDEAAVVEREGFDERDVVAGDFVLIVEEHECEAGVAGFVELVLEEAVESVDSVVGHGGHGSGAVEDEEKVGEVWVHGWWRWLVT